MPPLPHTNGGLKRGHSSCTGTGRPIETPRCDKGGRDSGGVGCMQLPPPLPPPSSNAQPRPIMGQLTGRIRGQQASTSACSRAGASRAGLKPLRVTPQPPHPTAHARGTRPPASSPPSQHPTSAPTATRAHMRTTRRHHVRWGSQRRPQRGVAAQRPQLPPGCVATPWSAEKTPGIGPHAASYAPAPPSFVVAAQAPDWAPGGPPQRWSRRGTRTRPGRQLGLGTPATGARCRCHTAGPAAIRRPAPRLLLVRCCGQRAPRQAPGWTTLHGGEGGPCCPTSPQRIPKHKYPHGACEQCARPVCVLGCAAGSGVYSRECAGERSSRTL
jgi:hypothetical protein